MGNSSQVCRLDIPSVSYEDTGSYRCDTESRFDNLSKTFNVNVLGKPGFKILLQGVRQRS